MTRTKSIFEMLYRLAIRQRLLPRPLVRLGASSGLRLLSLLKGTYVPSDISTMNFHMLLGVWESGTVSVCSRWLGAGMTAIDVGAHVGYYSRIFAQIVGPSGNVYAFEPHNGNFRYLERNVQRLGQVTSLQMAVTDRDGTVLIHESSVGTGSHSLHPSRYAYTRAIPVEGISLDTFLGEKSVDLVKIDVEGAELEVLEGMRKTIENSPGIALIVEFCPAILASRRLRPRALLDRLGEFDLELAVIDEDNGKLVPLDSWQSYDDFISWVEKYVNLFATKPPGL